MLRRKQVQANIQARFKKLNEDVEIKFNEWDDAGNALEESVAKRERFAKRNKKYLTKEQRESSII